MMFNATITDDAHEQQKQQRRRRRRQRKKKTIRWRADAQLICLKAIVGAEIRFYGVTNVIYCLVYNLKILN